MPALAIPYLKPTVLNTVQARVDKRSLRLPLFNYFTRELYDTDKIKIVAEVIEAEQGRWVGQDQPSNIVQPGAMTEIYVEPAYVRHKHVWSNSQLSLFNEFMDLTAQKIGGGVMTRLDAKVQREINAVTQRIRMFSAELIHDAYVGALLGSYIYEINGVSSTINYGLDDLSGYLSGDWDVAATDIPEDFDTLLQAFVDEGDGSPATHVFCNSALWTHLRRNTAFAAKLDDSTAARAFFASLNQLQGATSEPDPLYGLRWCPIDGSRIKAGVSTARWPTNKITLAYLPEGGERNLEHAQVRDLLNPTLGHNFSVGGDLEGDPPEAWVRSSDNGVAVIRNTNHIKTVTIY